MHRLGAIAAAFRGEPPEPRAGDRERGREVGGERLEAVAAIAIRDHADPHAGRDVAGEEHQVVEAALDLGQFTRHARGAVDRDRQVESSFGQIAEVFDESEELARVERRDRVGREARPRGFVVRRRHEERAVEAELPAIRTQPGPPTVIAAQVGGRGDRGESRRERSDVGGARAQHDRDEGLLGIFGEVRVAARQGQFDREQSVGLDAGSRQRVDAAGEPIRRERVPAAKQRADHARVLLRGERRGEVDRRRGSARRPPSRTRAPATRDRGASPRGAGSRPRRRRPRAASCRARDGPRSRRRGGNSGRFAPPGAWLRPPRPSRSRSGSCGRADRSADRVPPSDRGSPESRRRAPRGSPRSAVECRGEHCHVGQWR